MTIISSVREHIGSARQRSGGCRPGSDRGDLPGHGSP